MQRDTLTYRGRGRAWREGVIKKGSEAWCAEMEFLRSLVPTVISGEGVAPETALSREKGAAALPRETGPRLLSMRRLSLLAMGSTVQEEDASARPPRPTGLRGTQDMRGQRSARERGVRKGERGRDKVRGQGSWPEQCC